MQKLKNTYYLETESYGLKLPIFSFFLASIDIQDCLRLWLLEFEYLCTQIVGFYRDEGVLLLGFFYFDFVFAYASGVACLR